MNETDQIVRILLLEQPAPGKAVFEQLIKPSFPFAEFLTTSSKTDFVAAIKVFNPHILLFENTFANFPVNDALQQLQELKLNTPLIVICSECDEAAAVSAVEEGAADYVIKNRPARLPVAIKKALQHQKINEQQHLYQQFLRDASIIVYINPEGTIIHTGEQLSKLSGLHPEEYVGKPFQHFFSGTFDHQDFNKCNKVGKLWSGVLVSKTKTGEKIWLDANVYKDDSMGTAPHLIAVCHNITEQKLLKLQLADHQRHEKVKVAAITLAVQEKERNIIGQELHDNVNQILVGIKLLLASLMNRSEGVHEYIKLCYFNIDTAIEENRKISSVLITPDFEEQNFLRQVQLLLDSMLGIAGINIHIESALFDETHLEKGQKLAVYRIIQEQCTNVVKYASAGNVYLALSTAGNLFKMSFADDGVGVSSTAAKKGIGLKNIAYRIAIFNGTINTISAPGCGFSLQIKMPLQVKRSIAPPDLRANNNN